MRKLFFFLLLLTPLFGLSQTQIKEESPADVYQIKFQKPVKCIQKIEYEKTGEEIKGWLDEEKKTIYLENYKVNNRVKIKVIYVDDLEESTVRSACTVELSPRKIL
jgi:hypothetical protein